MAEAEAGRPKTRWLDEHEQQTWRAFLWVSRLLFEELERQLQRDAGMPHAYYMILAMLSEAPQRTMTMADLAGMVRSSPSRLSHALARMEEAGWVRKAKPSENRRMTLATLTDEGFAVLEEIAPEHVETVRRLLFDPLTRSQTEELRHCLVALLQTLDPHGESPEIFGKHRRDEAGDP